MSLVKSNCLYTRTHEWILFENSTATIGITDYAQSELGEVVYVDQMIDIGESVSLEEPVVSVESTKSTSDILSPVSGVVVAYNEAVEDDSEIVNQDPYESGWIVKIKCKSDPDRSTLLTSEAYQDYLSSLT